jgi:hypothetical protein
VLRSLLSETAVKQFLSERFVCTWYGLVGAASHHGQPRMASSTARIASAHLTPPKTCAPIPHLRGPFNAVIDGHRDRRDRRDRASFRHAPWGGTPATVGAVTAVTAATASPLGFAVAAVTTVTVEPRPARTLIWLGEGPRCRRERHDRVTVVLVRTSRRGLRWPRHSTKMSNGREPRCRPWGPR